MILNNYSIDYLWLKGTSICRAWLGEVWKGVAIPRVASLGEASLGVACLGLAISMACLGNTKFIWNRQKTLLYRILTIQKFIF